MSIQIFLRKYHLDDLSIIRDLEAEVVQEIVTNLSKIIPPPLKRSNLEKELEKVFPDQREKVSAITNILLHLYGIRRVRDIEPNELLEGLNYGIDRADAEIRWKDDEIARWKELGRHLIELFSISNIFTVSKALELAYDYTNLLQSAKILTDVRPVFNSDASEIQGAIVSYTLRISYDSREGDKNLSIACDTQDVQKLLEKCQRALDKAKTAKTSLQNQGINAIHISGEEG